MDFKETTNKLWKDLKQLENENHKLEKQYETLTLEHKKVTLELGEIEYANYKSMLTFNKSLNKRKNIQANLAKVTTQISKTEINIHLIMKQLQTTDVIINDLTIKSFTEEKQKLTEELKSLTNEREELLKEIGTINFASSKDLSSVQCDKSE